VADIVTEHRGIQNKQSMMYHGQNRGKQISKLSQKRKLIEIRKEFINLAEIGGIYKFYGIGGIY